MCFTGVAVIGLFIAIGVCLIRRTIEIIQVYRADKKEDNKCAEYVLEKDAFEAVKWRLRENE
ncbi:hypothetical protein DXA36_24475 [Eisenbergiella sp. OF01-20]|nr:hypothetical protein DXA36_24475 [Eisenbergiella sp. OF01-20]